MRLDRSDISYSREMLEKYLTNIEKVDALEHERFSEGLTGRIGNRELWYGKLPSGRYVYMYCWTFFSLRQLI